jgi:hypothetical protein
MASFQQGSLSPKQGVFLGSDTLGNSKFNIYFRVPTGLASDAGDIPIVSTVTLANNDTKSSPQGIEIAPPPSLVAFPEEVHIGETNVSIRLHGNGAHFDASTTVTLGGAVQIEGTTFVDGTDLVVIASVAGNSPGSAAITVSSGGTDPKKHEVILGSLMVTAAPSPLIRAASLGEIEGPPGAIIEIDGLFQVPDSVHHNIVEWSVGGNAFSMLPIKETSSTMQVIVPLWPNPDGTVYFGSARLTVRTSGNANQFDFTIDPLPANQKPRGAFFNEILDSLNNSIAPLQTALTSIYTSPQSISTFQATTGGAVSILSPVRQFVNSEASGVPAVAPGGTQPIPLLQFDLVERLLLTSALPSIQSANKSNERNASLAIPPSSGLSVSEGEMLGAASVCNASGQVSEILQTIQTDLYIAAGVSATLGLFTGGAPLGVAAITAEAGSLIGEVAFVPTVIQLACSSFPVAMSSISIDLQSNTLTIPSNSSETVSVTGKFSICGNPTASLSMVLEELLSAALERQFKWLPVGQTFLQGIINGLVDVIASRTIDLVQKILTPLMGNWLGLSLDTNPIFSVSLTPATTTLLSDNFSVALVPPNILSVQGIGPGTTAIHANPHSFGFIVTSAGSCHATDNPLDLPGNSAPITIVGPPLTIPSNSGGATGIITVTTSGNSVDKAYVPIPDLGVVAVLNADGTTGTKPISSVAMPAGFSPNATAADPVSSSVYVISYSSASIVRIDAKSDLLSGMFPIPVSTNQGFSGGTCIICGVVVDVPSNKIIIATAAGYFVFDDKTSQIIGIIPDHPTENFGYNPLSRQLVNPYYGAPFFSSVHGVDLIDLANGNVAPIGNLPANIFKPDAAAVDYSTNIAVIANEAESTPIGVLAFLNLQGATSSSGQLVVPISTYTFPDASGVCSGGGDSSEWTMLAVDSLSHMLFFSNEFSNCAGVLDLPPLGSAGPPSAASSVRFGKVPTSPDGQEWANSLDPHGTAVFLSVIDGRTYGFLIRRDGRYIARIDLQKLQAAPVLAGTQNIVDLSSLVVFLPTLKNEP